MHSETRFSHPNKTDEASKVLPARDLLITKLVTAS